MKTNDVILKSLSAIISGCIFLLSLSLYFGGHFLPGGGFVGGLLCTMALALAMFTYGIDRVMKLIPINYVYVTALMSMSLLWEKWNYTQQLSST